jgi:hypothetical protein
MSDAIAPAIVVTPQSTDPVVAAPTTSETATPVVPAPEEKVNKSDLFAAKAESEKIKRQYEVKLKAAEIQLAEMKKMREDEDRSFNESPLKYLEKRGLNYQSLLEQKLGLEKENTPEAQQAKILSELKEKTDRLEKERAEEKEAAKQRAEQNAFASFRGEVSKFVGTNSEKYEYTHLHGDEAINTIVELIKADFEAKAKDIGPVEAWKERLTFDKAAEKVESFYEERIILATKAKKWQAKADQAKSAPVVTPTQPTAKPRTIDKSMTGRTAPDSQPKKRTFEERIAAAVLAAQKNTSSAR